MTVDDELLRRVAEDVLGEEIGEVPGHPPYVDTAAGNYPLDYCVTTDAILDALEEQGLLNFTCVCAGDDYEWVLTVDQGKVEKTHGKGATRLEALCRAALEAVEEA